MALSLRTLDDGAWVSAADERRTGASELWHVTGVCECPIAEFVVEGVTDVAVDGRTVAAETYGRCITCGRSTTTAPIPVGRVIDGRYEPIDRDAIRRPVGSSASA
ncbi:hypothetical protein [Halopenitus persicus]|uniref:hypothetical protein n=1 Tax=Halopenitus persicus TaxID=1048396 RepID=UPI000BBB63E0|nr:hypothetical protein [Halopenitus persicus]